MYYFIVNPNSKTGKGNRIWKVVEKQLNLACVEYEVRITTRPGEARDFAREFSERAGASSKIVVVLGGDGTVNEVLDGLSLHTPVTLGYIPAGSGNDLARSLKIPVKPRKALRHIIQPKYHKLMDYGVATYGTDEIAHRRFAVSCGIGYDAAVCHDLFKSKAKQVMNKLHMGRLIYIYTGVKEWFTCRPSKGYLLLDGSRKVEFNHIYFVSAHIHPYEGGGFCFAPSADCSDGCLELAVCSSISKLKLAGVLLQTMISGKPGKGIRSYQCREALIHMDRPMPVHTDGELCGCQNELQLQCIAKKVRIIL